MEAGKGKKEEESHRKVNLRTRKRKLAENKNKPKMKPKKELHDNEEKKFRASVFDNQLSNNSGSGDCGNVASYGVTVMACVVNVAT